MVIKALVVVAALLIAAVGYLLIRGPGVSAPLTEPPGLVAECTASTGLDSDACEAWGTRLVAQGAPSTTFELQDVTRLRLDRHLFGLGGCRVEWFISRFRYEPVWDDESSCPGSEP